MTQQLNGTHGSAARPADVSMLDEAIDRETDHPGVSAGSLDHSKEAFSRLELLLRETIHRCSNDLQLVVSLLSLQAKRLKDREGRAALEDAAERIAVLARARAASAKEDHSVRIPGSSRAVFRRDAAQCSD